MYIFVFLWRDEPSCDWDQQVSQNFPLFDFNNYINKEALAYRQKRQPHKT